MRLKERAEYEARSLLRKFGRWAWISENGGRSPLSRLFNELAKGKSMERIADEIQHLAIDPVIRDKALLLLGRTRAHELLDDTVGVRIDNVISFVINQGWGEHAEFIRYLINRIYVESGRGVQLSRITKDLFGHNVELDPEAATMNLTDFPQTEKRVYQTIRKVREVFEVDFWLAYAAVSHLPYKAKHGDVLAQLELFAHNHFTCGVVDVSQLQVKTFTATRQELAELIVRKCK